MMNSNKALLLISASGLLLMPCGISLAAYSPQSSLPDAITSVYTHFTHTSHPEEMLLSSCEDFNFITLTRSLRSDLSPQGRGGKGAMSYSGLTGVSRLDKAAASFHLDPRIKSEDDTSLVTSPYERGEVGA